MSRLWIISRHLQPGNISIRKPASVSRRGRNRPAPANPRCNKNDEAVLPASVSSCLSPGMGLSSALGLGLTSALDLGLGWGLEPHPVLISGLVLGPGLGNNYS